VDQAINLWAFPLENKSIILVIIVLIHVYKRCVLIDSYGVNGKVSAEKYEDSYKVRILMTFMIQDKCYECLFFKK